MLGDKSKKTKLINHIVSHTFPTESRTINLNYTYIYTIYVERKNKRTLRLSGILILIQGSANNNIHHKHFGICQIFQIKKYYQGVGGGHS